MNNTFIIDLDNRQEYTIVLRATKEELIELGKKYNKIYNLLYQWDEAEYTKYLNYILNALDCFVNLKGEMGHAETDDRK